MHACSYIIYIYTYSCVLKHLSNPNFILHMCGFHPNTNSRPQRCEAQAACTCIFTQSVCSVAQRTSRPKDLEKTGQPFRVKNGNWKTNRSDPVDALLATAAISTYDVHSSCHVWGIPMEPHIGTSRQSRLPHLWEHEPQACGGDVGGFWNPMDPRQGARQRALLRLAVGQ